MRGARQCRWRQPSRGYSVSCNVCERGTGGLREERHVMAACLLVEGDASEAPLRGEIEDVGDALLRALGERREGEGRNACR